MMKKKDGTGTESDSLERLSNDRKMTLYSNLKAGLGLHTVHKPLAYIT